MSELKPCPFCGGEAEYYTYEQEHDLYDSNTLGFLETYETTEHYVGCKECLAMVGTFVTKKQAIKSWNTRAERTCHPFVSPDGAGWYAIGCSNCGHGFADNNPDKAYLLRISKRSDIMPRYCSGCGAKVEVVE